MSTNKRECPHCAGDLTKYEDPAAVDLIANLTAQLTEAQARAEKAERERDENHKMWEHWQTEAVKAQGELFELKQIDWNLVLKTAAEATESLRQQLAASKARVEAVEKERDEFQSRLTSEWAVALERDALAAECCRMRTALEFVRANVYHDLSKMAIAARVDAALSTPQSAPRVQGGEEKDQKLNQLVEEIAKTSVGIHRLYEAVCGGNYPDSNYATHDAVLLKLATERAIALRQKLEEWVQPCFCVGREGKCLLCETRDLLPGVGEELKVNPAAIDAAKAQGGEE